jgi:acyl-CoA synthetase (AMP-forming)/AMP-acid ligase II
LVHAFERTVARRPEAALVASPEKRATAAALAALARVLCEGPVSGFRRGSLVGLAAPNGPAFLGGLLALLRADLRPVLLDAATPRVERDRILLALGAGGCLTATEAWPTAVEAFVPTTYPGRVELSGPALIKISSGSTGHPRGVLTPTAWPAWPSPP